MSVAAVTRGDASLTVTVEGDGPPLLFLHGLLGQAAVTRAEAPVGYRVATYDQRGHASGPTFREPSAYAIDEFAADAIAVLDGLGWDRATIVGESMGAAVALRVAIQVPGRVMSLALVGPAFADTPNESSDAFDAICETLTAGGVAATIDAVRSSLLARGFPAKATAGLDSWMAHHAEPLACAVRNVSTWVPFPDLEAAVAGLGVPLAVVAWPDDPMHPIALAERVVAAGRGQLVLLGSVADVLGDPAAVSRALTDALAAATLASRWAASEMAIEEVEDA